MANYYGKARSNYFRVKDIQTFKNEMSIYGLQVHQDGLTVCMVSSCEEGIPTHYYDEKLDDTVDFDLVDKIAKHLKEDEVAVLLEVGSEKLRSLYGYAVAVNNKGKRQEICLNDIYKLAAILGDNVTRAVD